MFVSRSLACLFSAHWYIPAAAGHRSPLSSCGVVKGSWPLLYLRETLICCHVGYQSFALLTLLGVVGGSGGGSGHGSAASSFWWRHDLVSQMSIFPRERMDFDK